MLNWPASTRWPPYKTVITMERVQTADHGRHVERLDLVGLERSSNRTSAERRNFALSYSSRENALTTRIAVRFSCRMVPTSPCHSGSSSSRDVTACM